VRGIRFLVTLITLFTGILPGVLLYLAAGVVMSWSDGPSEDSSPGFASTDRGPVLLGVCRRLAARLLPGGYLVLGAAERLPPILTEGLTLYVRPPRVACAAAGVKRTGKPTDHEYMVGVWAQKATTASHNSDCNNVCMQLIAK
jgi:hypothetical protein